MIHQMRLSVVVVALGTFPSNGRVLDRAGAETPLKLSRKTQNDFETFLSGG